jgi:UDP-2-acetamido-2-deoxy-ribo-hexuluronate aminotransferase
MATAIPFVDLKAQYRRIQDDVQARIDAVLEHGAYIMGPEVAELEAALSQFCGARNTIAVSSGTDALQASLMALEIGAGDAVYLPAFTFTATAEAVLNLGACPVFVDVREANFNIDPAALAQALTETRGASLRPRAVIAVDLFGLPADYDELTSVAQANDLVVIADAAQSFGAESDGRKVGTMATLTCTSFFPAKPLGCYGDGGAIFTDDDKLAEILRSIRAHGKGGDKYDIVRLGMNGRLDTMQAAVLLAKLQVFADELEARDRIAAFYDQHLPATVALPKRLNRTSSAWAQYTIRLPRRDQVADALKARGIPTAIYYPRPMHLQTAYREYGQGVGSLPVSEMLSDEVLSLPIHPYLDEDSAGRICAAIAAELD